MEFRVADFERLSFHFKKYQDGLNRIDDVKKTYIDKIEPLKKEMQSIILAAESGIVIDQNSEKQRYDKFQALQQDALSIDKDAKYELSKMKDELTKEVYSDLESMISEWSIQNNIDIVIGKLEVVYMNSKYEITDDILDILKSKGLYVDDKSFSEVDKV